MAVAALKTHRMTGTGGDNGDGISGRTYHWVKTTSPQTPWERPVGNTTEKGRFFFENEQWYGITGLKPSAANGGRFGRINNWHDFAMAGYSWGYVSPLAVDLNGGPSSKVVTEFLGGGGVTSPCSGYVQDGVAPHTVFLNPSIAYDVWNWLYWRITWSRSCTVGHVLAYLVNPGRSLSAGPVINQFGRTLNPNPSVFPGVNFFHGLYISSAYTGGTVTMEVAEDRWGRSWQEAYDDVPTFVAEWGSSLSTYQALGTTIDPATIGIPTEIAGSINTGGAPPPPPPPPVDTSAPSLEGGPWFGNPLAESQNDGLTSANRKSAAAFQADTTLDLNRVLLSCAGGGGSTTALRCVVYAMSGDPATGGQPTSLLAQSQPVTVAGDAARAWVECPISSPARITAGQWYAIGYQTDGGNLRVHWANSGGYFFFQDSDAYADGASLTFAVTSQDTRRLAIAAGGITARRTTGTRSGTRTGTGTRRAGEGGGGG